MLNTLAAKIVALATPKAPAPAGGGLDTQGIIGWAATNILPLIFCGLGIIVLLKANKGDMSKIANIVGVAIAGVILFGSAAALRAFGTDLTGVIFK